MSVIRLSGSASLECLVDRGTHEIVEVVEVPEDRAMRDAGALGDLGRARVQVALADHVQQRRDHRRAIAGAAKCASVDRIVHLSYGGSGLCVGHAPTLTS